MDKMTEMLAIDYVQAGLVVLASLIVAKLTDLVICRGLRKLTARTSTDFDDQVISILHRPIFVTVVLIGLMIATRLLTLPDGLRFGLVGLLKTLAVLLWASALFRIVSIVLHGLSDLADQVRWIEPRTLPLLDNLAKLAIAGMALYVLLVIWDLNVGPWLASAGIAGIAIGFAAKDTLANLFGGLFIVADSPYKLGDYIVLDTGERGMVTKIGLRSTRLLTRDDIEVTVPNAAIAAAKIVNESGGPYEKARITATVGVAYGSDVDKVRRVLLEAAAAVAQVTQDPEPRVRFTEFGDSSLNFRLLCWIDQPALRGQALDALNTQIYKRFDAEDIHIPFPQRDLYIKQSGPA